MNADDAMLTGCFWLVALAIVAVFVGLGVRFGLWWKAAFPCLFEMFGACF
jgi:hypothetical protein